MFSLTLLPVLRFFPEGHWRTYIFYELFSSQFDNTLFSTTRFKIIVGILWRLIATVVSGFKDIIGSLHRQAWASKQENYGFSAVDRILLIYCLTAFADKLYLTYLPRATTWRYCLCDPLVEYKRGALFSTALTGLIILAPPQRLWDTSWDSSLFSTP